MTVKCEVDQCAYSCFLMCHTKVNFCIRVPSQWVKESISSNVCAVHLNSRGMAIKEQN
jgi:hypothetical protein